MDIGHCEDCKYWNSQREGQRKPCDRINSEGDADIALDGANLPAAQQRFLTSPAFGCSFFEAIAGPTDPQPQQPQELPRPSNDQPATGPQNLDDFLT